MDGEDAGVVRCPNCGTTDNHHDLRQDGFSEYRCDNENCAVEVFRVDD